MTLNHTFADSNLTAALGAFITAIARALPNRLASVLLYGSILFNDLVPGYSDLDFLAVAENELTESDCAALIAARGPFRSGRHGSYGPMLEGAFCPRRLLDPEAERASGLVGYERRTCQRRPRTRLVLSAPYSRTGVGGVGRGPSAPDSHRVFRSSSPRNAVEL